MQQEWERIQSEILPAKLLKDNLNLSECFDVKENVNSDFAYVTLTKQHVSKTAGARLNFHSKKHMICLEIIIWTAKGDLKTYYKTIFCSKVALDE